MAISFRIWFLTGEITPDIQTKWEKLYEHFMGRGTYPDNSHLIQDSLKKKKTYINCFNYRLIFDSQKSKKLQRFAPEWTTWERKMAWNLAPSISFYEEFLGPWLRWQEKLPPALIPNSNKDIVMSSPSYFSTQNSMFTEF